MTARYTSNSSSAAHTPVTYWLTIDEPDAEPFRLDRPVTIGRHLDNDLVLAGEDVRDFHVRLELSDRGPRVFALEHATVHVGDRVVDGTLGVMPGDQIVIGHHRIHLTCDAPSGGGRWALHEIGNPVGVALENEVLVGRGEACGLKLREGHVSRRHALLKRIGDVVWIKDLGSSNGTFVNGEPVVGARQLYHGDELAFDLLRFQLIGDSPELTPIRPPGEPPLEPLPELPPIEAGPTSGSPSRRTADPDAQPPVPLAPGHGPRLLVESESEPSTSHALRLGRQVVGTAADADIRLTARGVAARHVEVELRPGGALLVNLMPPTDTALNGAEVHTAKLIDGDEIRIGEVRLVYRAPERVVAPNGKWMRVGAGLLLAIALVTVVLWLG